MYKNLQKLIRWQEWFDTKLPLIVMIAYYANLRYQQPIWDATIRICLYGAGLLAFGYLVNDISDQEPDRLVGKQRVVHQLSRIQAWSTTITIVLIMIISLWPYFLRQPFIVSMSFIFSICVAMAYSLYPFRLKERGWLGLVTASAAQRSIPAFVAAICLYTLDLVILAILLVYFLNGLRYIILHQVMDAQNDRIAKLQTYMLTGNRLSVSRTYLSLLLLGEIIILMIIPLGMPINLRWVNLTFWPFGLYWILRLIFQKQNAYPLTFDQTPLQTFYFVIWPFSLIIAGSLFNPAMWALFIIEVLWKRRLLNQFIRRLKTSDE